MRVDVNLFFWGLDFQGKENTKGHEQVSSM